MITRIVDDDVTDKLLIEKATEHDDLRLPNIDSGVTAEIKISNKLVQINFEILAKISYLKEKKKRNFLPARLRKGSTKVRRRCSNPVMHFLSSVHRSSLSVSHFSKNEKHEGAFLSIKD